MSFVIHGLAWDTEHFGFPCANIDISGILQENDVSEISNLSRQYRFVTIHNPDVFEANEKVFLNLPNVIKTDVNIRLCNDGPLISPIEMREDFSVSLSSNCSLDANVFEAVQGSFVHSRFYQDKHISTEKADGVFYNWLKNAQNRPDKYFCICRSQAHCAGVMLLSFLDAKNVVIELLSVSREFQRLGIGTAMMQCLGEFCRQNGITKIWVGTQKRNSAALTFYKKNNFKLDKKIHIYHMWND